MAPGHDDRLAAQPGAAPAQPGAAPEQPEAAPGAEVRIALVLSGGISLAVYMHGVVQEVLRLQRAARGQVGGGGTNAAYRALAARAGVDVLVDVISGTSAGGLNGVLLAKALAAGGNLDAALPLWVEAADIAHLLHKAGEPAPDSLLRPDYFAQQLHTALTGIDETADPHLALSHPVLDLYVHATDYGGRRVTTADYLGTILRTRDHRKAFRLRLRRPVGYSSYDRNDFYDRRDDGARRRKNALLTRIGMASAALPPAFPAVQLTRAEAGDLMDVADADRAWYVDGGIMDNKPFRSALEAIKWRAASRPVDRFIFLSTPIRRNFSPGSGLDGQPGGPHSRRRHRQRRRHPRRRTLPRWRSPPRRSHRRRWKWLSATGPCPVTTPSPAACATCRIGTGAPSRCGALSGRQRLRLPGSPGKAPLTAPTCD